MAQIRKHFSNHKEVPVASNEIIVQESRTVVLPDPPEIPAGKMAFRMVYKNGEFRDVFGDSRFDCTGKAINQARQDNMNFHSTDIVAFNKV